MHNEGCEFITALPLSLVLPTKEDQQTEPHVASPGPPTDSEMGRAEFLLEAPGVTSLPCLFQLPEASHTPWLVALFLNLKVHHHCVYSSIVKSLSDYSWERSPF